MKEIHRKITTRQHKKAGRTLLCRHAHGIHKSNKVFIREFVCVISKEKNRPVGGFRVGDVSQPGRPVSECSI
jgi:hypothetical protein